MQLAALIAKGKSFGDVTVELLMGEGLYSSKPNEGRTAIML